MKDRPPPNHSHGALEGLHRGSEQRELESGSEARINSTRQYRTPAYAAARARTSRVLAPTSATVRRRTAARPWDARWPALGAVAASVALERPAGP